jgi:eukaryotic-like serine/threonine-protein kinase
MAPGLAEPVVWPNTAQYKRALQRPDLAFNDPELKRAQLEMDMMGTPACVEGQSAVVFFGQIDSGIDRGVDRGRVTVRCLKRPVAHGERRYAALHRYLADRRAVPLATVEWQSAGVFVDGQPWPIVRMEHVDGMSMRQYVSRHIHTGAELQALSEQWRDLAAALRQHDLAHGDLQQDNVRVLDGGALRLIDLDAVWAPPLAGMPPSECGHRHFQHPERLRTAYWDSAVDAFSTLVIYVSLRAVAADPSLWDHHHNDENLILTDEDFENPGKTPIWARLAASRDLEVRDLLPILEQFCKQTVRVEIDLATILRTRTLPGGDVYVPKGKRLQRADWWVDGPPGPAGVVAAEPDGSSTSPEPSGPPGAAPAFPPPPATWWPGPMPSGPPKPDAPPPTGVVDQWPFDLSRATAPHGVPTQPHPPAGGGNRRLVVILIVVFVLVLILLVLGSGG